MKIRRMIQKPLATALALLMAGSMAACAKDQPAETTAPSETTMPATTAAPTTTPPETTVPATEPQLFNEGLDKLRNEMKSTSAIGGIIFLGYTEKSLTDSGFFHELSNQAALLRYPFILEIGNDRYAQNDGGEVYCIIPADPASEIEVVGWDVDTCHPDAVLYRSESGEPIIMQGNASDLMANMAVTITDSNGQTLTYYQPHISLKDGKVVTTMDPEPILLDFTGYPEVVPDETEPPMEENTEEQMQEDPEEIPFVAPEYEGLDEVRLTMEPSAAIAAVIYLGYTEAAPGDDNFFDSLQNQAALEKYPFIKDIPLEFCSKNDGGEVYVIIPADPIATVEVCFWDTDTDTAGDLIYQNYMGDPIILQGNASDIMPNLAVTIIDSYGNNLVSYRPAISLKDGTVATPNGDDDPVVLDLTGY